jgi:hypothetical protein
VFLLVTSFLEVALVALFGQRDGLAVPLGPAAGLLAGDEQDAGASRVEREQDPHRAWSQLLERLLAVVVPVLVLTDDVLVLTGDAAVVVHAR